MNYNTKPKRGSCDILYHTKIIMITVTAIITTYQRDVWYIERAIKSIINQTYKVKEIILVDDNKNNSFYCKELQCLCERYEDVYYVKQNGNQGACAARNLGISYANGKYIAFLDDDDEWQKLKIEEQLAVITQNSKIGLVYCCGFLENEDTGERKIYYNFETFKPIITFQDLLKYDYIGSTSQPLIRAECFEKVGGFDINQPARQDYEMWMRIAQKYEIRGVNKKLFIHYIHEGEQISKSKEKSYKGFVNIYKKFKYDYSKDIVCEIAILDRIIGSRSRIDYMCFFYYFKRFFLKCISHLIKRGDQL